MSQVLFSILLGAEFTPKSLSYHWQYNKYKNRAAGNVFLLCAGISCTCKLFPTHSLRIIKSCSLHKASYSNSGSVFARVSCKISKLSFSVMECNYVIGCMEWS